MDPISSDWNPNEALKNLTLEKAFDSTLTPQQIAKRLFEENLPVAVMAVCHLATHSETEAIRFNAAKFVVERTMGPAERLTGMGDGKHAWDDVYENVTDEAERYLNAQ